MKVGLYNAPSSLSYHYTNPPLGLASITAYLRKNNIDVIQDDLELQIKYINETSIEHYKKINKNIFNDFLRVQKYLTGANDYYLDKITNRILSLINYKSLDLIGFSIVGGHSILPVLCLAKKLKKISKAKIVIGGAYPTLIGFKLLEKYNFIDFAIRGSGEIGLLKIAKKIDGDFHISKIPGLVYFDGKKININSPCSLEEEELPVPDFDGLPLKKYEILYGSLALPYRISSGCYYNCNFCLHRRFRGPVLKFKSIKKVIAELLFLKKKYNPNGFRFNDSMINFKQSYLYDLCNDIIKSNLDTNWIAMARAQRLDKRTLQKMKESKCKRLAFGIESGSEQILEFMNKKLDLEDAKIIIQNSNEVGILNTIFLIAGIIGEQKTDILKTIKFIDDNARYLASANLNLFTVRLNSPIYLSPKSFGIQNLIPKNPFSIEHQYDLINGTLWEEVSKMQQDSYKSVLKSIQKNNLIRMPEVII